MKAIMPVDGPLYALQRMSQPAFESTWQKTHHGPPQPMPGHGMAVWTSHYFYVRNLRLEEGDGLFEGGGILCSLPASRKPSVSGNDWQIKSQKCCWKIEVNGRGWGTLQMSLPDWASWISGHFYQSFPYHLHSCSLDFKSWPKSDARTRPCPGVYRVFTTRCLRPA